MYSSEDSKFVEKLPESDRAYYLGAEGSEVDEDGQDTHSGGRGRSGKKNGGGKSKN